MTSLDLNSLKKNFELKELELNALLEITQSINSNLPEDSLYKIFNFTLRANLKIKKVALFVKDKQWECKVNFGTVNDFNNLSFDEDIIDFEGLDNHKNSRFPDPFSEFEKVLPVRHKDNLLAIVFLGGNDQKDYLNGMINTNFIQALSNIIIVAIENKKLARRELDQKAFQKELEIARNVQHFLFPKNLPYNQGLKIYSSYQPHQMVGGDYFDYIAIDENKFLLCIADVSGKGIPAALLMSNFQASLRTLIRQTTELEKIVRELNYQILQNSNGESFITFFAAIYNMKKRELKYVNAGHNPPLFYSKDSDLIQLELGTTILGIFDSLPFLKIGCIKNIDKWFFFAFTDGLIEVFNEKGEQFGIERVYDIIRNNLGSDLKYLHEKILKNVNEFNGETSLNDDITLLSCKFD